MKFKNVKGKNLVKALEKSINKEVTKEVSKETTREVNINKVTEVNKSSIFKRTHELTEQFCKKYTDVDYRAEFSLMLKLVYEELSNGILDRPIEFPFRYVDSEGNKPTANIVRHQFMVDKPDVMQGVVEYNSEKYYFVAEGQHFTLPVVFGAKSKSMLLTVRRAIEKIEPGFYTKEFSESDGLACNYSKMKDGVFVYSPDNVSFRGYYRNRAFEWTVDKERYPRTCAFSTLIKDLDRPGKKSFRSMKGAGAKLESEIDLVMGICNSMYPEVIGEEISIKPSKGSQAEVIMTEELQNVIDKAAEEKEKAREESRQRRVAQREARERKRKAEKEKREEAIRRINEKNGLVDTTSEKASVETKEPEFKELTKEELSKLNSAQKMMYRLKKKKAEAIAQHATL